METRRYASDESYELFKDEPGCSPLIDGAKGVRKEKIYDAFELKKKMIFLFDYGDEWLFLVECMGISDPLPKVKYPRVAETVGEAPEQYPDYDEEGDED